MRPEDLDLLISPAPAEPSLKPIWATVAHTNPLRLRPDAETVDIGGVVDLVGDLSLGDRVWAILHNGQVYVLGMVGGKPIPQPPAKEEAVIGGTPIPATLSTATLNLKYYEKYPDGLLVCKDVFRFPGSGAGSQVWTFPVPFVHSAPAVSLIANTAAPQNVSIGQGACGLTSVTVTYYRSTDTATYISAEARGRWK